MAILIQTGCGMDQAEFDKFADEYRNLHRKSIGLSGEEPDFFVEYKVRDACSLLSTVGHEQRVLDFGAGTGASVPFFQRVCSSARITCLDVSSRSLDIGREHFSAIADFVHFDGIRIPFNDAHFDMVFAACVFHHINRAEHLPLLREILRILKPGGRFIGFEHNPLNPLTVRAVNTCPFDENAVLIPATAFQHVLGAAGFAEIQRRYRVFFPRALRVLRRLEKHMTWLPIGAQYFVTGVRRSGE